MTQQSTIEAVEQADVAASVNAGQARRHPITKAAGFLSEIADQPPAFTLSAAAVVAGIVADRRDLAEAGARSFLALAVATLAKSSIKASVTRTRPFMIFDRGHYARYAGGRDDGPWNSFPSGHSANAAAVASAIVRVFPEAVLPATLAAAAIGAVQIPRATHYPLDVAAGALIGLAADALVTAIWPVGRTKAHRRKRR